MHSMTLRSIVNMIRTSPAKTKALVVCMIEKEIYKKSWNRRCLVAKLFCENPIRRHASNNKYKILSSIKIVKFLVDYQL